MSTKIDSDQKLDAPPPYRPSIDQIFLDKLSEPDRYLVQKLDQIDQRIEWLIVVALSSNNRSIDLKLEMAEMEKKFNTLEQRVAQLENVPEDDKAIMKWLREHKVIGKIIGWAIAAVAGAAILQIVSNIFGGQ